MARRMALRRRLWETYHSRGRPAGSRFFAGGTGSGGWKGIGSCRSSGSVVAVATAIGILLAAWWNLTNSLHFTAH